MYICHIESQDGEKFFQQGIIRSDRKLDELDWTNCQNHSCACLIFLWNLMISSLWTPRIDSPIPFGALSLNHEKGLKLSCLCLVFNRFKCKRCLGISNTYSYKMWIERIIYSLIVKVRSVMRRFLCIKNSYNECLESLWREI